MYGHNAIRLGVSLLLGSIMLSQAEPQEVEEYQVKAAYLYNFAKFVEWPPQSFASPASPIVICVLGGDSFDGILDEVVRGKTAADRAVVVRQLADLSGAKSCHILFVDATAWKQNRAPFPTIAGSAVLTVGESPGFTASGGIIRLKLEGGRLRFEINVEAARQARLQISSKLLSLADIVKPRQ